MEIIASSMFDKSRTGGQTISQQVVFDSTIVIGGQIVGTWRRTFNKGAVVIELAPFAPLTAEQDAAIATAAQRYGDFVGMPVHFAHNA
jgi:hypothetical protein